MPRSIKTEICGWCRTPFETRKQAKYCSLSCAAKHRRARDGHPPYRPEEVAILEDLSGFQPLKQIVAAIQKNNEAHGWEPRSIMSVQREMVRRGLSYDCVCDNLSAKKLAETLGVSRRRVCYWLHHLHLPHSKISHAKYLIPLKGFRRWAHANSRYLVGLDYERLLWIFQDSDLALKLSQAKPCRSGMPIKLRRLDTYKEYPSLEEAARDNYVTPSALRFHLSQGKRQFICGDIPWEVA